MPQKTTADLISHAENHLSSAESRESQREAVISIGLFSLAGFIVLGLAIELISQSLRAGTPAYVAGDSADYAAQQAFYTGTEVMHGAAGSVVEAQEAVHAAAQAAQALPVIWAIGGALLLAGLWRLEANGFFARMRPSFTIHKIK